MLTMPPGPDIAPYHDRQIVVLERNAWTDWLNPDVSAKTLIKPLMPGALTVSRLIPQGHLAGRGTWAPMLRSAL